MCIASCVLCASFSQGPILRNQSAWGTLVHILTLPDAQPAERLFCAQSLLHRVKAFDLADALEVARLGLRLIASHTELWM